MLYDFELIGNTPLLMHADDVEASDDLKAWRDDPRNRSLSVPGDDRSPPWTWQTYLYSDGRHLVVPADNLMIALRNAAAKIPFKKQQTFKQLSQSGMTVTSEYCRLEVAEGKNWRQVPTAMIADLRDRSFAEQARLVKEMGLSLLVKRAKVGTAKHVRVRLRLEAGWRVTGSVNVSEPAITAKVLGEMFEMAGRVSGLLDWRPSSPKSPGSYGMFKATLAAA